MSDFGVMPTTNIAHASGMLLKGSEAEPYVELWAVKGLPGLFYANKLLAESIARTVHPNKDTNAMVYYQRFYKEES